MTKERTVLRIAFQSWCNRRLSVYRSWDMCIPHKVFLKVILSTRQTSFHALGTIILIREILEQVPTSAATALYMLDSFKRLLPQWFVKAERRFVKGTKKIILFRIAIVPD